MSGSDDGTARRGGRILSQAWPFVLLGLAGMGLRWFWLQPPWNTDDVSYWLLAVGQGGGGEGAHVLRLPLLALVHGWVALVGSNAVAFYLAVYTIPLLSFGAVVLFARTFLDRSAALLVALWWASGFNALQVETRLLPDGLGTAFALLGLTALARAAGWPPVRAGEAGSENITNHSPAPWIHPDRLAFLAGLAMWAAVSIRTSFAFHVLAGLGILASVRGERRWRAAGLALAGGVAGLAVEMTLDFLRLGDVWARYRTLLGYGGRVASDPWFFGVNSPLDLILRYPRTLHYTQSGELWLHGAGMGGALLWWFQRRQPGRWALLAGLGLTYGFLALAVVRLNPLVPLMRAAPRYYLTVEPFFLLAAASLAVWLWRWPRVAPTFVRRARLVGLGPVMAGVLVMVPVGLNLGAASRTPEAARNGNDAYLAGPRVMAEHHQATGHPAVVYSGKTSLRVLEMFLPATAGWAMRPLVHTPDGSGYLWYDWRKMSYNAWVWRGTHPSPEEQGVVERHPVLWRHITPWRGVGYVTDLFLPGATPIQRESRAAADLPGADDLPPGGSLRRGGGVPLPGGWLVQAIFSLAARDDGRGPALATLDVSLTGRRGDRFVEQPLGRVVADGTSREWRLWTWLPEEMTDWSLQWVHREGKGARLEGASLRLLARHERDVLRQRGGAW
ncbi:MAG: hypothetical protein HQL51_12475 [Magnetococcales bacterium]|nr:hypothetical protein [Magnetococcales bacterium]